GASAVKRTDWEPLKGRDVIIWPDADEPGRKAAAELGQALQAVGAGRVYILGSGDEPEGWDVADAIADGWTPAMITKWIKGHIRKVFPADEMVNGTDNQAPAPESDLETPPTIKSRSEERRV